MREQTALRHLWVLVGLITLSQPAMAWNAAGHRLSAAIAWRQMSAPTREAVGNALAHHPDHPVWLKRSAKQEPAYAALLEASTWPDDIKRDKRFFDPGDAETPVLPGFSYMSRHRDWHHLDHPIGHRPKDNRAGGKLDAQLTSLIQTVEAANTSEPSRAIALSWLIHLVADAHQPLHVVSRYDEAGRGDDGGNALLIENPFHPRRSGTTLHAYWDDLPGAPWLRGERLEAVADSLTTLGGNPRSAKTVDHWVSESRTLAVTVAYADLEGEVPTLSATYHERALQTARNRVALAGKRLGMLLEQLFDPAVVPRGTLRR
jgi:hypothetical protein